LRKIAARAAPLSRLRERGWGEGFASSAKAIGSRGVLALLSRRCNRWAASDRGEILRALTLAFTHRFIVLTLCVLASIGLAIIIGGSMMKRWDIPLGLALAVFVGLSLLGVRDLLQTHHSILRNYPISAHLRFLLEDIRPELRQYFFEGEKDGLPFPRDRRAVVYQRAKLALDKRPFGTQFDTYAPGYEWLQHSMAPRPLAAESFRVSVGGPDCAQPYSISVLNISAMSFGSLSAAAIRALNAGAKKGGFAHDTGEGGFSPYHREHGGDIIWEIGSGYFGCRNPDGSFNPQKFSDVAANDQIKMIEIKLSQGAKPGHGGVLPGAKVTAEIAAIRGVAEGQDCLSPACHTAFSTPIEMMKFVAELRRLSQGKPVGFKLCLGHSWEFLAVCKAMLETTIYPDFIVVDGKEGGTGAAPLEFMDNLGMPMREGLVFVHNALVGIGARAHPDRRRRQDRHRFRHGAGDGARRRLVQFGARLHVFARLHPVAELSHRPLPDRRRDAGSEPQSRPRRI
jgi:glutamate synthase domain-containing protein 2